MIPGPFSWATNAGASQKQKHPRKLIWNLKIQPLRRRNIYKQPILRGFHVCFRRCNPLTYVETDSIILTPDSISCNLNIGWHWPNYIHIYIYRQLWWTQPSTRPLSPPYLANFLPVLASCLTALGVFQTPWVLGLNSGFRGSSKIWKKPSDTADASEIRRLPAEVGSLSYHLGQVFLHCRYIVSQISEPLSVGSARHWARGVLRDVPRRLDIYLWLDICVPQSGHLPQIFG